MIIDLDPSGLPLTALGVGAVATAAVALLARRPGAWPYDPPGPSDTSAGLSEVALAVLAVEQQRLGPEAFARSLASVFPGADTSRRHSASAFPPEIKGAIATLVATGLIGALWYQGATPAAPPPAPPAPTAPVAAAAAPAPQAPMGQLQALEARLATNPDDLAALNDLTVLAMGARDAESAIRWSDRALAVAPKDAEARVNRAILTQMLGMDDAAMKQLDAVLAEIPNEPGASVYKGLMLMQQNRPAEALPYLEVAVAGGLTEPQVTAALADARSRVGEGASVP